MPSESCDPAGLGAANDDARRYESFVVRVSVLPSGEVRAVRLEHVRSGEVSHMADLAEAFREINARINEAGDSTLPGRPPPDDR